MCMRTLTVLVCSCLLCLLCLCGCGSQEQQKVGGVAVVDLVEVVKRIGHDAELNKSLKQEQESLNQKYQELQKSLSEKYDQEKKEFGEKPTEEQKKQLLQLQNKHRVLLDRERVGSQQQLYAFKQRLVNRFREQVKPAAREVAAEKGLTVVITKHEGVLTVDDAVEITDEVVAKMLENSSEQSKPK